MPVERFLTEEETIKDSLEVEETAYHATEFRVIKYSKSKQQEFITDIWYPHIVSLSIIAKRLISLMFLAIPIAIAGVILLLAVFWLGVVFVGIGALSWIVGFLLKRTFFKITATNETWEIHVNDMDATKKFMRNIRQYSVSSTKEPSKTLDEIPEDKTIKREEIEDDLKELWDI